MNVLTEKAEIDRTKRIWEIDAFRGLLILCLLGYHLYQTVTAFCINGYYDIDSITYINRTDPLHFWYTISSTGEIQPGYFPYFAMKYLQPLCVNTFFVLSGISYRFSRNNLKGCVRLMCGAAFVSLFTFLIVLFTSNKGQFIRFGALHCYALCHFIHYLALENRSNRFLIITAFIIFALGYYLKLNPVQTKFALLVPFGFYEYGSIHRDYWPVFPMLGWFLLGVVIGRKYYSKKRTLFPKQNSYKWHRFFCFLGQYSGLIYCGHMVIYTVVFCGIGFIFNLY